MEKFINLKLSKELLKAIEDAGFKEPSEIQVKTIPLVLEGKDVIGSSSTGSGKTLAFGAGIIDKLKKGAGIQTLILTPTRELAQQVTNNLKFFSKYSHLSIADVYGGVAMGPQVEALKKSEIVVGTPGRLLDHLNKKTLNLDGIKFLVLDEADKMLEMGFIEDVQKIINECSRERQTLLFSATISGDIEALAKRYMKHPVYVEVESYVDASKLKQIFYDVPQESKFSLLVHLLKNEKSGLVMVFCNTRRNADFLAKNLSRYDLDGLAIHGGLSQNRRDSILKRFHSQNVLILICTDVAARGLHVDGISHVYNYDTPNTSKEYVHRIGRTARAGKEGIAISIVAKRDYDNFRRVLADDSLKISQEELPEFETLQVRFNEGRSGRDSGGGYRGNRGRSSGGNTRSSGGYGSRGRSSSGDRDRGERRGYRDDNRDGRRSEGSRGGGYRGSRGRSSSGRSSGGSRSNAGRKRFGSRR